MNSFSVLEFGVRHFEHIECDEKAAHKMLGKLQFRCSTKVDENGAHIGGIDAWGYCDNDCLTGTQGKEDYLVKSRGLGVDPTKLFFVENIFLCFFLISSWFVSIKLGNNEQLGTNQHF